MTASRDSMLRRTGSSTTHAGADSGTRAERDLFAAAIEQVSESVLITDRDGVIVYANAKAETDTGYSSGELIGQTPRILSSGEHSVSFYRQMWRDLLDGKQFEAVFRNRRKDGTPLVEEKRICSITGADGRISHFIATARDVTEPKGMAKERLYLSYRDALTGLGNRRMLIETGQRILSAATGKGRIISLLLMDLDNFKRVNDTLGHVAGDSLLIQVGRRLRGNVGKEEILTRTGGDEFALLLSRYEPGETEDFARGMLQQLQGPFHLSDRSGKRCTVVVNASVGVARFPDDGGDIHELMRKADIAMYRVKSNGGGVSSYDSTADVYAYGRLQMEHELRLALRESSIELVFQPIVSLAGNTVHGAEALARWHHPSMGMVPPSDFIPIAEEAGFIVDLDWYVMERAVRHVSQCPYPDLRISVNLSPQCFMHPDLTEFVEQLVARHQVQPERVCLEITEGTLADPVLVGPVVEGLRQLGVEIAVDDFGTGYSSLSYLSQLRPDVVKVDKSFIQRIGDSDADADITRGILAMAHSLGMAVVAEGVETTQQLEWLRDNGCDLIQGYIISRPSNIREFHAWYDARQPRSEKEG